MEAEIGMIMATKPKIAGRPQKLEEAKNRFFQMEQKGVHLVNTLILSFWLIEL